jgi:diphthine-ammonia ligase
VESVALRLGLTPLSYLWQYPTLPPGTQTSLLRDMLDVGLDARIVKVASGGIDESFLWENVASEKGMSRVERSMRRFGVDGDGSVLGEGGEFETLVVDGPSNLFKGRIEIQQEDRKIVREGGGSAWLKILRAEVVMKPAEVATHVCRIPDILDLRFTAVLESLTDSSRAGEPVSTGQNPSVGFDDLALADTKVSDLSSLKSSQETSLHWTVTGSQMQSSDAVILKVQQLLDHLSLSSSSIISTTIILRSMADFASVNSVEFHTSLKCLVHILIVY